MPYWGDETHDWAGIEACVDILYDRLGKLDGFMQAKEKFGYIRCYIALKDDDIPEYRAAYIECVRLHPELYQYIIGFSDFPEHLIGIIKPEDCSHSVLLASLKSKVKTCAICGFDIVKDGVNG